ncbi:unnamed protein product [Discosporangium mesarthrocarpum]
MAPTMSWMVAALAAAVVGRVEGFLPLGRVALTSAMRGARYSSPTTLSMGIDFKKMFENMGDNRYAKARHILIEEKGPEVKAKLEEVKESIGGDVDKFAEVAKEMSKCTSAANGGLLKLLGRGETVPEFDEVLFTREPGQVYGPVETAYGTHLIYLISCNKPQNTWGMLFDDVVKAVKGEGGDK